ncbi:Sulfate/thiosulfate import ATP-binding protein CysA [bacterium HR40]|nr:Sulfate/thiosulfate import ATP-binding protein CysA [bacterium HR40]
MSASSPSGPVATRPSPSRSAEASGRRQAPAAPYLQLEAITKRFGGFAAVREVSLAVAEGEFVCFLGPSGCGKTTLLRIVAGLERQSEGRIVQAGRDISTLSPRERDFGIVFQSYALFPNLTVRRNIAYGLESRGLPRSRVRQRVEELLALVGLEPHADKYPAQLSGGQQQRVALARALAPAPGLLLLDEPLSALDAKVRLHLRHELRDLQRRLGVTTIMVTHDQEEALSLADRIVVMNAGRVEQIGTPIEVYQRPASPFVADFVGVTNFLEAEVVGEGRCRCGDLELRVETAGRRAGEAVLLAFRPEDALLRDVGREANPLEAEVLRTDFLGPVVRAEVAVESLAERTFLLDLSINLVRDLGLQPGMRIRFALPAERIRLFARDAAPWR